MRTKTACCPRSSQAILAEWKVPQIESGCPDCAPDFTFDALICVEPD